MLGVGTGLGKAGLLRLGERLALVDLTFEARDTSAEPFDLLVEGGVLIGLVGGIWRGRKRRRAEVRVGAEGTVVPGGELTAQFEAMKRLARRAPVLVGGVVSGTADGIE